MNLPVSSRQLSPRSDFITSRFPLRSAGGSHSAYVRGEAVVVEWYDHGADALYEFAKLAVFKRAAYAQLLGGKHRSEPVPPQPHRLVSDVDASLEQQVFHVPQRQRVLQVDHHHQADHLGRRVEIAKGVW